MKKDILDHVKSEAGENNNSIKSAFRLKNEDGSHSLLARGAAVMIAAVGLKTMAASTLTLTSGGRNEFFNSLQLGNQNVVAYAATTSTKDQLSAAITKTSVAVADKPSLESFLSSLYCSGCHRHCPLTNLGCGRGEIYKEQATAEYNQKYIQISNVAASTSTTLNWSNYTLNVSPGSINVKVKGKIALNVKASPKAGTGASAVSADTLVTYTVKNTSIANVSINSSGKAVITGLKKGSTSMVIKSKTNKSITKIVYINVQ